MGYNLEDLKQLIIEWGKKRDLIRPENVHSQFVKLVEEVGELASGIVKNKDEVRRDSLGDIFVLTCMLSAVLGYNLTEEVTKVYHIIDARTGVTTNGVYVKQEDIDN